MCDLILENEEAVWWGYHIWLGYAVFLQKLSISFTSKKINYT